MTKVLGGRAPQAAPQSWLPWQDPLAHGPRLPVPPCPLFAEGGTQPASTNTVPPVRSLCWRVLGRTRVLWTHL